MNWIRSVSYTAMMLAAGYACGATFTVTNVNDSGPGSLRQAVLDANGAAGADTVAFNIASPAKVIAPLTPLPDIAADTTVDGTTQPGYGGNPLVEIDFTSVPNGNSIPPCWRDYGTVKGLAVNGCPWAGLASFPGATVSSNWLGLDLTGTQNHTNRVGVVVLGGTVSGNVVSGNWTAGIDIRGGNPQVTNNWIGPNGSGTAVVGNTNGIVYEAQPGTGPGVVSDNIIAGTGTIGITVVISEGAYIANNTIGFLPSGAPAKLAQCVYIDQSHSSTLIHNTIANCQGNAVQIQSTANRNLITQNSMYDNFFGIYMQTYHAGQTDNDPGDADTGANDLQNYPIVTSAKVSGNNTLVSGTLNSKPNQSYTIEIFSSPACNAYGSGEGKTYLGSTTVSTDGAGNASFSGTYPLFPSGSSITATATDSLNNTSEFSTCAAVQGAGQFRFASAGAQAQEHSGSLVLTVLRTDGAAGAASVDYATVAGTATAGSDFTPTSGTLQFADGETSKTFSIPILQDSAYEGHETFRAVLSNATGGAVIGSPSAVDIGINDDEPLPKMSIADARVVEGDTGTSTMLFQVTMSPATSATVLMGFRTDGGTAYSGEDFQQYAGGGVTFQPGETVKTIPVTIYGDTKFEPDEKFSASIYVSGGVNMIRSLAVGTIVNDDPAPSIAVADVRVVEGNAHTTTNATVTLISSQPITGNIAYATADGTARAGQDYQAATGTVSFSNETVKTISIPILGDNDTEADETITLTFGSNTTGSALARNTVVITIANDDAGFGPAAQTVPLGKTAELDLSLGTAPASPISVALSSSNPGILAVPAAVMVSDAVTPLTFAGNAVGSTTLTVTIPPPYAQTYSAQVTVYEPANLVIRPAPVVIPEGKTLRLTASFDPPLTAPTLVQLRAGNAAVIDVPPSVLVPAGGEAAFMVAALTRGSTVLVTTLGGDHGNQQGSIFVDVVEASAPLILSVTPASGPVTGGTYVSIEGTNLAADCTVAFGGLMAASTFVTPALITATAPAAHSAGPVDVVLSCGSNVFQLTSRFTYVAARARPVRH
jgi:hypothetical protein